MAFSSTLYISRPWSVVRHEDRIVLIDKILSLTSFSKWFPSRRIEDDVILKLVKVQNKHLDQRRKSNTQMRRQGSVDQGQIGVSTFLKDRTERVIIRT